MLRTALAATGTADSSAPARLETACESRLDDVARWADVLHTARANGQLLPGNARFTKELTALSA